jgi:hypothetical protein
MIAVRLASSFVAAVLVCAAVPLGALQDSGPPRILLDQSPRAIEYQLQRLSDDRLVRVERRADDPRYVPVYYALLMRPAMPDDIREEALVALASLEKTTRAAVLLAALQRSAGVEAAVPLLRLMMSTPSDLHEERPRFEAALALPDASTFALRGAYAALLLGGTDPGVLWETAAARGHRSHYLLALSSLPSSGAESARRAARTYVDSSLRAGNDEERVAAIRAVPVVYEAADAFRMLAAEVARGGTADGMTAAVAGLELISRDAWPVTEIEPLASALTARIAAMPADERLAQSDQIAFAQRLTESLPADRATPIRARLRSLGVRVVRIRAIPEQVAFDVRWFVAQAGTPVQIVLVNPDAMPHNVVVSLPGSLEKVGTAAGTMSIPDDPAARAFVPDLPEVLHATRLVRQNETDRLTFTAPTEPGEYVFACTFPGHWLRMYGVMLVVPSLEAWEAKPVIPIDPMTKQPFAEAAADR